MPPRSAAIHPPLLIAVVLYGATSGMQPANLVLVGAPGRVQDLAVHNTVRIGLGTNLCGDTFLNIMVKCVPGGITVRWIQSWLKNHSQ